MKLITLNAWGGRVKEIKDFFFDNKDTDIFCLQEIYNGPPNYMTQGGLETNENIFGDINEILKNHNGYFCPQYNKNFGLAIFAHKDFKLIQEDNLCIYKYEGYKSKEHIADHARFVHSVSLEANGKNLNIFNLHALWNGNGKSDNEGRMEQSRRIIGYVRNFNGAKILCGDFNLLPDTQSIKEIENMPMRNLITEYGIDSTRTSYYKKPEKFADYIFVDKDINVKDFEVMKDEVSDHSALKLVFEVN